MCVICSYLTLEWLQIEVWSEQKKSQDEPYPEQQSLKWYGEQLLGSGNENEVIPTDPPPHRMSNDISVSKAVCVAYESDETKALSPLVRKAVMWHVYNTESTFGASTKDISIENYGFNCEHVPGGTAMIPRGHATLIAQLERQLKRKGDRFSCRLNCEVGSINYNYKPILPTGGGAVGGGSMIPISDACRVESSDGAVAINCDFVVCTLPLGVLKASLKPGHGPLFIPELPETKQDAIASMGFGLVNRVVIHFPEAFWRSSDPTEQIGVQFGNITDLHRQYSNFVDLGRLQPGPNDTFPAVLMTSSAGRDAVGMEKRKDEEIVQDVLQVLREIFAVVPPPSFYKVTRWGSDPFARGSYSFVPPGSSVQDFLTLKSPIHANGDTILSGSKHTARLFFAGEHTDTDYPCTTNGALRKCLETFQFLSYL